MAVVKKISELTAKGSNIGANDLVIVGVSNGTDYDLKSVTGNQLVGAAVAQTITDGVTTTAPSQDAVFDALALKQDILSGGTTNRLTKWSSSSAISNSLIQDNGTTLSIGTTPVANNLFKVSSNATDTTLVSENSQASGVGISGSSSGSNGVGGSFTSTSVTGVKIGVNASATGAGGTNKGAVFGATNGTTNYSIQLTDGTEGSGKFLKSVTANGEANWSSIANTDVSGLGTLATQSGTFSGTSSGTNTGDQIISDATITTTDITTNNFTTAKHGFVPKGTNVGNYLKDDGTWGAISAGGLTYFTEAQNTTAPNATVPVDSLTSVTSTTNGDFAIIPKGSGAILSRIPDDTLTGGNKRGLYAVDLQRIGYLNATTVASGNYSAILNGQGCKATGIYSNAFGYISYATGDYSFAFGNISAASNTNTIAFQGGLASGSGSIALSGTSSGTNSFSMQGGTATGTNSVAFHGGTSSGSYSFNTGYLGTASGDYSATFGGKANTFGLSSRISIGCFPNDTGGLGSGYQQQSSSTVAGQTDNATAKSLNSYPSSIALVLQNNQAMRIKGSIIGKQASSTNVGAWDFDCVIVRGTTAATTTIANSNVNLVVNTGTFGTPTLTANTSSGGLDIKVIGVLATTINWSSSISSVEIIQA